MLARVAALRKGTKDGEKRKKKGHEDDPTLGSTLGATPPHLHLEESSSTRLPKIPYIVPHQETVRMFYANNKVQVVVALLIIGNFLVNIIEKEVDPQGGVSPKLWRDFEDAFNVIFLAELLVNFYGNFFYPFWRSGWNIFDFIVVTVGVLSLSRAPLPGPLSLLRLLRAFRVFRLFKRLPSLNKIIVSLGRALPGVVNAFLVMLIFMCIYAIIAVEFFSEFGQDGCPNSWNSPPGNCSSGTAVDQQVALLASGGNASTSSCEEHEAVCYYTDTATWTDEYDQRAVESTTARGFTYGFEYYGSFMKALFTLFQVLTGESWAEAVARPLLFGWNAVGAGIFFVSFIIINAIVLINVVVAVLLEKMVDDDDDDDDKDKEKGRQSSTVVFDAQAASMIEESLKSSGAASELATISQTLSELTREVAQMRAEIAALRRNNAAGSSDDRDATPDWSARAPRPGSVVAVVGSVIDTPQKAHRKSASPMLSA